MPDEENPDDYELDHLDTLVKAIEDADAEITRLGKAVEKAQREFDIGASSYAAVRDMVRKAAHCDPYSPLLTRYSAGLTEDLPSDGKYRFLLMPVGTAVLQILAEAPTSQSVPEIKKVLLKGGADVDGRAINAALMTLVRVGRVEKHVGTEDVAYFQAHVNQWGLDYHYGARPEGWHTPFSAEPPTPATVPADDQMKIEFKEKVIESQKKALKQEQDALKKMKAATGSSSSGKKKTSERPDAKKSEDVAQC